MWLYIGVPIIALAYANFAGMTEFSGLGIVMISYAPLLSVYYAAVLDGNKEKSVVADAMYKRTVLYDVFMLPLFVIWFIVSYKERGSYNCLMFYVISVAITYILVTLMWFLGRVLQSEKMALAVVYAIFMMEIIYLHEPEMSIDILLFFVGYSGAMDIYFGIWILRYAILCFILYSIGKKGII